MQKVTVGEFIEYLTEAVKEGRTTAEAELIVRSGEGLTGFDLIIDDYQASEEEVRIYI
jgi:hypothetical protein